MKDSAVAIWSLSVLARGRAVHRAASGETRENDLRSLNVLLLLCNRCALPGLFLPKGNVLCWRQKHPYSNHLIELAWLLPNSMKPHVTTLAACPQRVRAVESKAFDVIYTLMTRNNPRHALRPKSARLSSPSHVHIYRTLCPRKILNLAE